MKILHVVPRLRNEDGGVSGYVAEQCLALVENGQDVGIAFLDVGVISESILAAERRGVRLHRFRLAWKRGNPVLFSWDFVRRLARVIDEYDVVHIDANWLFPVWWTAFVAHRLRRPYVMMPHGSFAPERLRCSHWKKIVVGWLDRWAARRAVALWATDEREARSIRAYVPTVREVEVFPIGLRRPDVKERGTDAHEDARRTLLSLSRLSPVKGLDLLAEAWGRVQAVNARAHSWCLAIVGPDERGYRAKLERVFATKCPVGTYSFSDAAYGAEKWSLLASADAFILPTRNENWGISVAEAMASGLPVICTKGAPWPCLETARAGWWCEVSVEGLVGALNELVSCTDKERADRGNRARQWVRDNLDWRQIGREMVASYEKLVREVRKCAI